MKKWTISLLVVFVLVLSVSAYAEEVYDISIEMQIGENESLVNGVVSAIDENEKVVPFVENGRTLVPLRFVASNLALDVEWIQDTQSVILTNASTEIILNIDDNTALVNGNFYELDCAPILKDARTFVPVRFIAQALQCDVVWESNSQKVLVRREKEVELDINDAEVQQLFQDVIQQKEFASYYPGYCDTDVWDNPQNMFSGTMRELFSFLRFEGFEEKEYTKEEAEAIVLDFLSEGDLSHSLSTTGLDSLKRQIEQGMNFGSDGDEEILVGVYDGKVFDTVSMDLFGATLPRHENVAYSVGYHRAHLFNRVNLFCPNTNVNSYIVYYNEASDRYLFMNAIEVFGDGEEAEAYDFETKLVKATAHNGKISLYIQHYTEFHEYSGEPSTYQGIYKNTYKKDDNGYYWVRSYGMDEVEA